jgi:hypothetical protein
MSEYDIKTHCRTWRATYEAVDVVPVDEEIESSVKLA